MLGNSFPSRWKKTCRYIDKDLLAEHRESGGIIAEIECHTEKPVLPVKHNSRLCFPVGHIRTTVCYPELSLLDSLGIDYTINAIAYYEMNPLFHGFVESMYALRQRFKQEKNTVYDYFVKILMNSLYGKFGQRNEEWIFKGKTDSCRFGHDEIYNYDDLVEGKDDIEPLKVKWIAGSEFHSEGLKEGFDSLVAVSAFVTSYARVLLWNLLSKAGIENVYYCDTDSIFCNIDGYCNLIESIDEKQIGSLKVEETTGRLTVNNLKDYTFGAETKLKGVNKRAERLNENTYRCDQWQHFSGAVRARENETVLVKKVIKHNMAHYTKGVTNPAGLVTPLQLDMRIDQPIKKV
jgi:hypothetical protein